MHELPDGGRLVVLHGGAIFDDVDGGGAGEADIGGVFAGELGTQPHEFRQLVHHFQIGDVALALERDAVERALGGLPFVDESRGEGLVGGGEAEPPRPRCP